jgi:hypothetical protein
VNALGRLHSGAIAKEIDMKFFVSLLVLLLVPMTALNDLGRPAFIGYYLGVMTLGVVFACANARAARVPATE